MLVLLMLLCACPPDRVCPHSCVPVQALSRSASAKQDPELEKVLKAREKIQAEILVLDSSQRKLLNRCYSFDNRCTAFCNTGAK